MTEEKVSGRPLRSSSLLLFFKDKNYSFALIMLLELIFIHGSSPLTRKIRE
jgi:hypothetical protein